MQILNDDKVVASTTVKNTPITWNIKNVQQNEGE